MVDYLPDAHFVQVVLELFAAVQANHVALAVRLARLGDWRCGMAGRCAAFAAKSTRMRISSGVAAAAGVAAPYVQGLSPPNLGTRPALRHSHGGTGIESLHYPRFAARASCATFRGVVPMRADRK